MAIPAAYFDGKTSRRHSVELSIEAGMAILTGEAERRCPIAELRISERTHHGPRRVTFPDGAYLEVLDNASFAALLTATGYRDSPVVRMQQSWRGAVLACVVTIALLVLGYLYVLPLASEAVAKALPESAQLQIGHEVLDFLDQHLLRPSNLSAERRDAIRSRFESLTPPKKGMPTHDIVFRKSRIGPNAFALPSGGIVLTDDIVSLVDDDDAVIAILAHELGHLHERHLMRSLVQSAAVGAVAALLFGDVSSIIAGIPALILDLKYSRDAEREADDYAIAMLKANGIPVSSLARAFEKLATLGHGGPRYLSTHPSLPERIERIRNAR